MSKFASSTEADGRLKGTCVSCPFNDGVTEEATAGQNYGCLPSGADIIEMKRNSGQNWACHGNESCVCAGLCHRAASHQLDLTEGGLVRYSSWYYAGQDAAIEEARTGILYLVLPGTEFDASLAGRRGAGDAHGPWVIARPKNAYYLPRANDEAGPDRRTMILALGTPQFQDPGTPAVRDVLGMAELEVNPRDGGRTWFNYLCVEPAWQGKGIARRLVRMVAEHVSASGNELRLTNATEAGRARIQDYIDLVLDEHGIRWTQSNRDETTRAFMD